MKRHLEPDTKALAANERFLGDRREISGLVSALADPRDCAGLLSDATDRWLLELWEAAGGVDASIVALGGFGRRELCLGSDVDMVIEVGEGLSLSPELHECVQRFMAWARLTRVKLAHAVRTPEQAEEAFAADFRTVVAYLDARTLAGAPVVDRADAMRVLRADDEGEHFVGVLLQGYRERLRRFGQTIYLLEPEVKAGMGGLRDVHIVRWAARVRGGFDAESETSEVLGWTARDADALVEGHLWLLRLRSLLHVLHGRKHDRLHFPDQEQVAAMLGDADAPSTAAESLMRQHYQATRTIAKSAERSLRRWAPVTRTIECRIDETFHVGGGQLFIDTSKPLRADEVLEGLRLAAEFDVLLDPVAEGQLEQSVRSWSSEIRNDPTICALVRGLLTDPETSSRTSSRLLELGILQRIVPEFEPVVCHVQHDVYHVYTTDVHLLRCLEFSRTLLDPASANSAQWPAFAKIAGQTDPQLLLLSSLFHDIGKNRGGGHSERGAAIMLDVGPRLGLRADHTALLSFLVREHLTLAHVARRHDISDRRLIRDLAGRIRTVEALSQLTALTFADMCTVRRTPISDWNATLLLQLHDRLETAILHGVEEAWRLIERDVAAVRRWLNENLEDGRASVDAFVRDLPASYLVEAKAEALGRAFDAWRRGQQGETVVLATADPERGSTEVIISARDKPGVLAQITGALSSLGLNILDARLVTTSSGRLLDIFQVAQSGGAAHALGDAQQVAVTDEGRLTRLHERLLEVLAGERFAEELLQQRLAERKLAPRSTPQVGTSVEEQVDVSDSFTVVQVKAPDRVGLLYVIALTLAGCDVDIRLSKIDSLGTQVIDTFYLETLEGQKLDPDAVDAVVTALRDELT